MEAALNSLYGRTVLGPTPLRLGRAPDNTLVVNDPQSSSHHAEITPGYGGEGYQITDLNSTNGTFVNEQRISPSMPRPLNAGDVIRIGNTSFTYETTGGGYAPTVAVSPPSYEPTIAAAPPDVYTPQSGAGYGNFGAPAQPPYTPPPQSFPQPEYPQNAYPQQGYPQPAYPQPVGYPQQPGYPQPGNFQAGYQQPPRKSRTGCIVGVVIVLLLLIGGGVGAFAYVQSRPTPQKTLQTYCSDLKAGNYKDVYHLYSAKLRSRTSEDEFAKEFAAGIALLGGIKDCTVSNVVQDSSTAAHGSVTYTFNNGKTETESGPMVLEDGDWKLDSNANSSNT